MDLLELFGYLRQFNADVLVIGGIVAVCCFFLGKPLKGRVSDKFLVFLPFLLGAALYFAYGAVFAGNVAENAGIFVKNGFSCGSFATAAKVVAAQLFKKGEAPDRAALRAEGAGEMLFPPFLIPKADAERVAALAETDEEQAKAFILSLGAPETAAELAVNALKEI